MNQTIRVGMAEYKTAKSPLILTTLGLGSCVGVALYDKTIKVAGLAHIMLPDSRLSSKKRYNPGKFADTAIDALVENMIKLGANARNIKSKIAGGAQMFKVKSENSIMRIGKRNIEAVKQKLDLLNIEIVAEDVAGNYGRTVELHCETGAFTIKSIGRGVKVI